MALSWCRGSTTEVSVYKSWWQSIIDGVMAIWSSKQKSRSTNSKFWSFVAMFESHHTTVKLWWVNDGSANCSAFLVPTSNLINGWSLERHHRWKRSGESRMEDRNKGMSLHCLGIVTYGMLSVQFTVKGEQTLTPRKSVHWNLQMVWDVGNNKYVRLFLGYHMASWHF